MAKFINMYPIGFTHPQFQDSQEFALDGGVIFDILAKSSKSHANGVFILTF